MQQALYLLSCFKKYRNICVTAYSTLIITELFILVIIIDNCKVLYLVHGAEEKFNYKTGISLNKQASCLNNGKFNL